MYKLKINGEIKSTDAESAKKDPVEYLFTLPGRRPRHAAVGKPLFELPFTKSSVQFA